MSDFSIQIELWKQCNNFCEFCYLANQNKYVSDKMKLKNIKTVNNIIDSYFEKNFEQIKAIGFLGGEFFQGQITTKEVRNNFYSLFKKCFKLINEDRIRDFWCYCTLTIGDQKDLYELIDLFDRIVIDKNKHKFWIQVSYDIKGRFNKPGKFENWNYHMLNLQKYPFIRFNVTTILTQPFLESVLSNQFNIIDFQNKYKNVFFFKQPNVINDEDKINLIKKMPWFFCKRETFISFLKKIKLENFVLFNEILNISLRSDYMFNQLNEDEEDNNYTYNLHKRNKNTWEETNMETIFKCGHPENYQCYSDSDACCLCDYLKVKNSV